MSCQQVDHFLYAKGSGIVRGQALKGGSIKRMYGRNLFRRPKNDFGARSTLFSTQFYQKSIWAMLICSTCKFCLNNREIRDKIYSIKT